MPLVSGREIIRRTAEEGWAAGAFNVFNIETAQAVVRAAEAERAPVFLQVGPTGLAHGGPGALAAACLALARECAAPVAVHLDHAQDYDQVAACFAAGFTSLMYDGAAQPYAVNVAVTRRATALAAPAGVMVEGEIGQVGGAEEGVQVRPEDEDLTDPSEAARYVAETGVDALAIAAGTAHGRVIRAGHLAIERIAEIRACTRTPLVLHGASGVPDGDMRAAIAAGIAKINVATDLNRAFLAALAQTIEVGVAQNDPRAPLAASRAAVEEVVRAKIRLFGGSGMAG
jgi:fructose-bisphosphate aldolase class II